VLQAYSKVNALGGNSKGVGFSCLALINKQTEGPHRFAPGENTEGKDKNLYLLYLSCKENGSFLYMLHLSCKEKRLFLYMFEVSWQEFASFLYTLHF